MNSYVGMTMVKKKNRDKMIFTINKAYFRFTLLAYILSATNYQSTYVL